MYEELENELNELNNGIWELTEIAFSQCTLCDGCAGSCPTGINLPSLMRSIRSMATTAGTAPQTEALTLGSR